MRLRWLGSGALVCAIVVGCSKSPPSGTEALGTAQGGIQQANGDPGVLDGTAHPYAVGICKGTRGSCSSYCSGSLILPNLVVTARHCVSSYVHKIGPPPSDPKQIICTKQPTFNNDSPSSQWITTNPTMNDGTPSLWHQVQSYIVPDDPAVCGNDIALLVLATDVSAAEAKPAIPGVQYPMGDINRYVHRFTAIGYGNTGPNGFSAGTRRIRTGIPVECIPGDDFIACPMTLDDYVKPSEFPGGDGTCGGDSGSSAFDDKTVVKGAPVSFGVLSRGGDNSDPDAGTPATLCKGSVYTRLDAFRDLVVNAATTASANWTRYPRPSPDWTIYVPPPAEAGAPEAGPKKPQALGFACATNEECVSKVCADTGGGKECTKACDETVDPTDCQEGYICKASICVQDLGGGGTPTNTATPGTTTTTEDCSTARVGAGRFGGSVFAVGLGLAAALGLSRRRRRRHPS